MQPKNPSQESVHADADTFPLPAESAEGASGHNLEQAPQESDSQPESVESAPAKQERDLSDPEQNQKSTLSPQLPAPNGGLAQQHVTSSAPQADNTAVADDNTPMIADDVDVIEKEWVDKAKQIIAQTRNSPYRQEQEVERLQQSYLKKRYGKDVSSANQI